MTVPRLAVMQIRKLSPVENEIEFTVDEFAHHNPVVGGYLNSENGSTWLISSVDPATRKIVVTLCVVEPFQLPPRR